MDGRFGNIMDALFICFVLFLFLLVAGVIAILYGIVLGIYDSIMENKEDSETTDKNQKK